MPFTPLPLRLETERTVMTPQEPSDADWLAELFTSRGAGVVTREEAAVRISAIRALEAEHGIGARVLRAKSDGAPLGYCAIIVGRTTPEEPELAYELLPAARGLGYATEGSTALLAAAFGTGRTRIWSTVRAWNTPSLAVLARLGFRRDRSTFDEQGEVIWHVATAPDLRGIAEFWDSAASSFDDEPDHGLLDPATRSAWDARLRTWLPAAPQDVLDLGCGTGSLAVLLAQAGHRVTGVDLAPEMVDRARAKLAAAGLAGTFVVADAADPPGAPVDVVLARHLLWTLPDPWAALARWVRIVRPGGTLVLIEGRWSAPGPEPYATGAPALPWDGGVTADQLMDAVRPLVDTLRVEPLSGDALLWGRPVADERYALIARV